jgi:apolipoprotein N-acyltransferase
VPADPVALPADPVALPADPVALPAAGAPADLTAERSAEPAQPADEPAADEPSTAAPAALPTWAGVVLALAAGGALVLAFPPIGGWWLAPVGAALLAVAVHRRRIRAGAGLGALAGLAFFVPLLAWTEIVGGVAPWLILALSQSAFLALLGAGAAWFSPVADRYRWLWPPATAVFWVGEEALRDRIPFGGFPWGRLAFSQGDSALLRFASLGGAPLVTFAVALCGGLLAAAVWRPWRASRRTRLLGVATALGAVVVVIVGLVVPLSHPSGKAVDVAVIQGNVPRLGLDFNAQRRAVLDDHVNATLALARRVAAGTAAQPDLVIWPENSSDIDPLTPQDDDARALINEAADEIKAPILVGTLLEGPGDHLRNVGIVWQPGTGPTTPYYVKQHPVPFAEYMPLRSLARMVTKKVDLVAEDFVPGDRPGVLNMGAATVGDVICFEIAYDDLVRSAVQGGGQLITVQTNNADFNTAEARQQLAMVQLRAVEHGRDALMASTVGVSGFVTSDGTVLDATQFNTQAVLDRQLRLGSGQTVATRVGPVPEFVLAGIAVLLLVGAGVARRRARGAGNARPRAIVERGVAA